MRAMFEALSQRVHRWRRATVRGLVAVIAMIGPTAHAMQTTTYFHNDVSGTPQMETDAAGTVVWKESYQPYGSRLNNAPASADNKLWFTGKSYDANVGLSYMGARYYDPVIGRFAGVDPRPVDPSDVYSFNRYAYGNNNPYKYVDPDGKFSLPAIALGVATIIAISVALEPEANRDARVRSIVQAKDWVKGLIFKDGADGEEGAKKSPPNPNAATNADSESKEGSYTNTHESGKKYHGKGPKKRAQESGKEKAEENNDPVAEIDWTSAKNRREAFKDEAKRIRGDGGVQNPNNYNKINSPGEKYLNQDGN